MASSFCHVFAVTKRCRLERIVRPRWPLTHSLASRYLNAMNRWVPPSPAKKAAQANSNAPARAPVESCPASASNVKASRARVHTASLVRKAVRRNVLANRTPAIRKSAGITKGMYTMVGKITARTESMATAAMGKPNDFISGLTPELSRAVSGAATCASVANAHRRRNETASA